MTVIIIFLVCLTIWFVMAALHYRHKYIGDSGPKNWGNYLKGNELHVVPHNDVIVHRVSEDCKCQPHTEPVRRRDGSYGWLISHIAKDGRE